MADRPDDTPNDKQTRNDAQKRAEERDLVTAGEPLVDDDVLEQPTDDVDHDKGSGKDGPTPNPAKLAP